MYVNDNFGLLVGRVEAAVWAALRVRAVNWQLTAGRYAGDRATTRQPRRLRSE